VNNVDDDLPADIKAIMGKWYERKGMSWDDGEILFSFVRDQHSIITDMRKEGGEIEYVVCREGGDPDEYTHNIRDTMGEALGYVEYLQSLSHEPTRFIVYARRLLPLRTVKAKRRRKAKEKPLQMKCMRCLGTGDRSPGQSSHHYDRRSKSDDCVVCGGTGRVPPCEACKGKGEVDNGDTELHPCGRCCGTGVERR
jgi:hypothetical protein